MKRVITLLLFVTMFICNGLVVVNATEIKASPSEQKKIVVYLKPDVSVVLKGVKLAFRDSRGTIVYPIIYNGSTYLPIRAVSGLMNEPIEWDGASKTVFIGRTLSNPNKALVEVITSSAVVVSNADENSVSQASKLVSAYLKPDVLVMYDFALKTFEDANGSRVYPIIYNGSTYLPIRAISELMKEPIEWEGKAKTIYIGDSEEKPENIVEEEIMISQAAKKLKNLFEQEEILYYEATAKTTSLKEIASLEEKQLVAAAISENYSNAQSLTTDIKSLDATEFTEKERIAYAKVIAFAESTEYYILVLENIAYLAAQDSDYSMLAETFLYFAMESQTKMEEARALIQEVNQ